jgi:hypothetical protein
MNRQDRSPRRRFDSAATSQATRGRYRIQQFVRGFRAKVGPDERTSALALLPETAWPLFNALPLDAQRHSLDVLSMLKSAGYQDPDLAAAALLHDMGKIAAQEAGAGISLWMRGLLVMVEAVAPDFLRDQARSEPTAGWRYAIYVHLEHPAIGAERARAVGCSELTCWLIAHHQDTLNAEKVIDNEGSTARKQGTVGCRKQLLDALQWADGLN